MAKHFSLLIALLLFISSDTFSQITGNDCSTFYYNTSFNIIDYTYNAHVVPLPHGEVAMGYLKGNAMYVEKLSSSGDTLWAKKYDVQSSYGGLDMDGLLDTDGNLLFASNNNYFIKIDTNGNIISAEKIQVNQELVFFKMALLSNGDKIMLFSGHAYDDAVFARFDKDLNRVKWCKYYHGVNPSFTDFCIDKDTVVFAGACSEHDYAFDSNPFIGKIDGTNGKLLALKYYKADSSFSGITDVHKGGSDYIADCKVNKVDANGDTRAFIRFDNQLRVKSAKRITGFYDWLARDVTFQFLPQKDGSFYVAYGADYNLALMYVDNKDNLKWVRDIPGLLCYPSDIESDNTSIFITGQINYFYVGQNTYGSVNYVVKSDMNGHVGDCPTEQKPQAYLTDYSFSPAQSTMMVVDTTLAITPVQATVSAYSPQINQNCVRVSTCNSLHLSGDSVSCNNDPLTITAIRNPGCTNPITFAVSPAVGVTFQENTDSTISLVFNKSGVYKIKAAMNVPCADSIQDSLTIHANLSGDVELGKDTFLCDGTSIVLHSGNQFKSYTWQDNSTDSDYTVSSAGQYYVTVCGYCNETYSDTINIFAATAYDFHGTNDTSKCNDDSLTLVAQGGFANYKWFPGYNMLKDSGQEVVVFPSVDTSYLVTALSPAGCYVKDTIRVAVNRSQNIFLGNDTSFCSGQSITLKVNGSFSSYRWDNGASSPVITVRSSGVYSVLATSSNGCVSKDTLVVQNVYDLPAFSLGKDTVLCENEFLDYNFNVPGASYLWNDGTTASSNHVNAAGTYWLQVSRNGCTVTDTLQLGYKPLPVVNLGNDTTLCEGTTINLNVENTNAVYEWQDGSTDSNYRVSKSGIYFATVTINNCFNSDTVEISYKKKPSFTFKEKPFICNGQQVRLSPAVEDANEYLWQDNTTAPWLLINKAGTYTLTVTNDCGSYSNSITVITGDCHLDIPNAFTPNNDGINDIFRVKFPQFIKLFHITIFNRFGEKVFETNDVNAGWDGKLKSADQPMGVYVWIVSLTDNDGITKSFKGTVSLIR